MSTLLQPGDNSFQATDELLPTVLSALIVGLLIGTEAGLHHAHMSTRISRVSVNVTTLPSPKVPQYRRVSCRVLQQRPRSR